MNKLLSMQALMLGLTASSFTQEERRYEPRPDTSNIGGGYAHSGYVFELLTEKEFELLKEVLL